MKKMCMECKHFESFNSEIDLSGWCKYPVPAYVSCVGKNHVDGFHATNCVMYEAIEVIESENTGN